MQVSEGLHPKYEDEDVRFRTTYYFRVFDYCQTEQGAIRQPFSLDTLYRYRMTGKARSLTNAVHFESGTLTASQIDPFGATVAFDEKNRQFFFKSQRQVESEANRERQFAELERLLNEYERIQARFENGEDAVPDAGEQALLEAFRATIRSQIAAIGGPQIEPEPGSLAAGRDRTASALEVTAAREAKKLSMARAEMNEAHLVWREKQEKAAIAEQDLTGAQERLANAVAGLAAAEQERGRAQEAFNKKKPTYDQAEIARNAAMQNVTHATSAVTAAEMDVAMKQAALDSVPADAAEDVHKPLQEALDAAKKDLAERQSEKEAKVTKLEQAEAKFKVEEQALKPFAEALLHWKDKEKTAGEEKSAAEQRKGQAESGKATAGQEVTDAEAELKEKGKKVEVLKLGAINAQIIATEARVKADKGTRCKDLRRGFQIMGPEGFRTFDQDERLIMAMTSSGRPLISTMQELSGRVLNSQPNEAEILLPLVREDLRLARAERALDRFDKESPAQGIEILEQALAAFDEASGEASQ